MVSLLLKAKPTMIVNESVAMRLPMLSLMVMVPWFASSTKLPAVGLRMPVALITAPGTPVKDPGRSRTLLVKSAWRDAKLTAATPVVSVEALCRNVPELKETPTAGSGRCRSWARAVDADVENVAVPKLEGNVE